MTARLTSKKWMIPFSLGERHHHPCNVCIIPFPDTRTMTTLQPTDTVEEHYTCNVCDQMFIRSRILTVDGGKLTGETPYSCNVCNESFSNTIRLMVHRLTHARGGGGGEATVMKTREVIKMEIATVTLKAPPSLCYPTR
ncbi:hypothetical protein QTP88_020163 [Uroleucon formosanum]